MPRAVSQPLVVSAAVVADRLVWLLGSAADRPVGRREADLADDRRAVRRGRAGPGPPGVNGTPGVGGTPGVKRTPGGYRRPRGHRRQAGDRRRRAQSEEWVPGGDGPDA